MRGPERDPAWGRPALFALLALTGVLYLWDLAASGYANSFYAAATQAGTQSWKAWFFGSLDAGNAITVDKPPAALWISGLSGRLFGFNSWSLLVPQALEGVAAVGLLYAAVRRVSGVGAGLLAGAALAVTPAAALMFRYDHPDALLTLLLVAAAYAVVRALEGGRTRWLVVAGSALGFAFLTKMLQGFLVLPGFGLVYLVAGPVPVRRRVRQLLAAAAAVVISAGWWVLAVALWPASARPYIGGSTDNSVLDLVFGYNGLGRLFGQGGGGGGGGGSDAAAGSSFGGATGLGRLFGSEMGNEISWLLPAALLALVLGLWARRGAGRTDRVRAALLLWGGWLIVTGVVFSYMRGTVHPYYTVALAPAIGGLVATGAYALWDRRAEVGARAGLAALVLAAAGWSWVLLARVPSWHPELRYTIAVLGVVGAAGLLPGGGRWRRMAVVSALVAGLLGSTSFALATAASTHTGSIPSAGPAAAASAGMGNGMGNGGPGGGGTPPSGAMPSGTSGTPSGGGDSSASSELVTALRATGGTWAAATVGDQSAAQLELASGKSVIAIGGWSGSDPAPTLAQFQAWVAAGRIGYFIAGGGQGAQGGSGTASEITAWVTANFTATTIGGQTVYDLSS